MKLIKAIYKRKLEMNIETFLTKQIYGVNPKRDNKLSVVYIFYIEKTKILRVRYGHKPIGNLHKSYKFRSTSYTKFPDSFRKYIRLNPYVIHHTIKTVI